MQIRTIGVPMDLGADRRGVDFGASAIRYAGLSEQLRHLGHSVHDIGNIVVPQPESQPLRVLRKRVVWSRRGLQSPRRGVFQPSGQAAGHSQTNTHACRASGWRQIDDRHDAQAGFGAVRSNSRRGDVRDRWLSDVRGAASPDSGEPA